MRGKTRSRKSWWPTCSGSCPWTIWAHKTTRTIRRLMCYKKLQMERAIEMSTRRWRRNSSAKVRTLGILTYSYLAKKVPMFLSQIGASECSNPVQSPTSIPWSQPRSPSGPDKTSSNRLRHATAWQEAVTSSSLRTNSSARLWCLMSYTTRCISIGWSKLSVTILHLTEYATF